MTITFEFQGQEMYSIIIPSNTKICKFEFEPVSEPWNGIKTRLPEISEIEFYTSHGETLT